MEGVSGEFQGEIWLSIYEEATIFSRRKLRGGYRTIAADMEL
jgi:hypothetical protein